MRNNINKVSERGERLDSLQDKTDNLAVSAQGFRRGANRVRKQMWWKDMKMRMCLIIGIILLLIVIIVPSGECSPPSLATESWMANHKPCSGRNEKTLKPLLDQPSVGYETVRIVWLYIVHEMARAEVIGNDTMPVKAVGLRCAAVGVQWTRRCTFATIHLLYHLPALFSTSKDGFVDDLAQKKAGALVNLFLESLRLPLPIASDSS